MGGPSVRQGLPRTRGGEPWPPVGVGVAEAAPSVTEAVAAPSRDIAPDAGADVVANSVDEVGVPPGHVALRQGLARFPGQGPWPPAGVAVALPVREEVVASPGGEPERRPSRRRLWLPLAVALAALVVLVLAARSLRTQDVVVQFVARYPGTYPLPAGAPVGIPAWLAWQHFFTLFLMALIVRTGLQIRREQRPAASWAPRWDPDRKVSLTVWFHQALDVLWLTNGVLYVVLLFATGQWLRVVPTSPDVFPHAASVALQYLSLTAPAENGWVAYNALQQLAYFVTIFVAAPLAVLSGVRLSTLWPQDDGKLGRAFPIGVARAVHFPVMVYFVVFIATHVAMVLLTGARRNLNHMFAGRGSASDPIAYATDWTGVIVLGVAVGVTVVAWIAARPAVLAPVAQLTGRVTNR